MRTKKIGRTEVEVSIVGLGASALGIPDRASLDLQYGRNSTGQVYMNEDLGVRTVHAALEAGATLIDTSPWYGSGTSELIIARAFRERPDLKERCFVTTKVGHLYLGDNFDYSYDAVMRSVEGSQRRLEQNHFRIVYLHDPMGQDMSFVMSQKGALGGLRRLQSERVIDYIGVAANDPETNADYIETGEFDAAVVPSAWTLINQTAFRRILPAAIKWNVGIVGAAPIERGLLVTGPPKKNIEYLGRVFPGECLDHVAKIQALCQEFNVPLAAAALQWCTLHPQVASVIPGAQIPEEARQNTLAGSYEIGDDFWSALKPLVRHWDFYST